MNRPTSVLVALMLASVLAAAAAVPAAAAGPRERAAARTASARDQAEKERRIAACVNTYRRARGIAPLAYDPALGRAARLHARNMRRYHFFDHTDPFGQDPADRVAKFTDRYGEGVGENIYEGVRTSSQACRGWMASPGHRANILDPDYTTIGTGYTGGARFWVQDFGVDRPRDPAPVPDPGFDY